MGKNRSTPPAADEVKARVLTNCHYGVANDVVTVTSAEAAEGVAAGVLDSAPDAVAYAESIDSIDPAGDAVIQ